MPTLQIKGKIKALLAEYVAGARDTAEAARCLTDLGVPAYHHEVGLQQQRDWPHRAWCTHVGDGLRRRVCPAHVD